MVVQGPPRPSLLCSVQSLQFENLTVSVSIFLGLGKPGELGARGTMNVQARLSEGKAGPAWLCSSHWCLMKVAPLAMSLPRSL